MTDETKSKINDTLYPNKGPMPDYDDPKPICMRCKSKVWVVSAGRIDAWHWYCTKCVSIFNPKV
jgi:hypothetical protein